ncbi:hypothetical protein AB0F72_17840 [Actinoplanes sp. NPDC023936]|uniref:hypothetical protein n=1 Tax=Actinoplanes sp. NPDC023936 TaxID=3154910 RepID=UPI0033D80C7D
MTRRCENGHRMRRRWWLAGGWICTGAVGTLLPGEPDADLAVALGEFAPRWARR